MESGDHNVVMSGLDIDSVYQDSFNCVLVILKYISLRSCGVSNCYKEVSGPILIKHSCVYCSCFCIGNAILFTGTSIYEDTIEEMNS